MLLIAETLHTHPAIVAGVPETMSAHFWFVWAKARLAAETDAQRQLSQRKRRGT